jgi:hypothetical protein
MKGSLFISIALLLVLVLNGCERIPLISENRKDFAPWEKLPEGNGITYLQKFTRDPGTDPIYLAKMKYDDDVALQLVVKTFRLIPVDDKNGVSSFAECLGDEKPAWFPLDGVTDIYIYPSGTGEYVSSLWVNRNAHEMILERSWW